MTLYETIKTFFALILTLKRSTVFSFIENISSALCGTILSTPTSLWCQPPPIWSGCCCKRLVLGLNFRTVRRWNNFVSARLEFTLILLSVLPPLQGESGTFHLWNHISLLSSVHRISTQWLLHPFGNCCDVYIKWVMSAWEILLSCGRAVENRGFWKGANALIAVVIYCWN